MTKASRMHHGDEFSKSASGGGIIGLDAPMIGAAASIAVDALTERESGVTPPPPPISVKALGIIFAVMFVLGVVLLWVLQSVPAPVLQYQ